MKKTIQVGADLRNKLFYVGTLGLRASQMTLRKGMKMNPLSSVQRHPHLSKMVHRPPWIEGRHYAILPPCQSYPFRQHPSL